MEPNYNIRIWVYKNTNDNKEEKLLYDRTFKADETKEVRMFGLKGKDEFEITGNVNKGLRLRVIGGKGWMGESQIPGCIYRFLKI